MPRPDFNAELNEFIEMTMIDLAAEERLDDKHLHDLCDYEREYKEDD